MNPLLLIVLTALCSSLLTLAGAWWVYRAVLEKRLDEQLLEIQTEFEQRVKFGVLAAGEELLPQFRKEVEAGFSEAVRNSGVNVAEAGLKTVAESANLLEKGLGRLFGLKPKR